MKKQLSKSETRDLGLPLQKSDRIEIEDDHVLFVNQQAAFFLHEGKWLPLLKFEQEHRLLKEIVVDAGAVKFVSSGADVMRPGIVGIPGDLACGEAVRIVDEKNHVVLAIGIALFSGAEMQAMAAGKAVRTVHHVGDKLWNSTFTKK
ncbi:MAG: PUA domain-containing protein [Nanoarchaeota archaeon]